MELENTVATPEDLEISAAFAEFAADPTPPAKPATTTEPAPVAAIADPAPAAAATEPAPAVVTEPAPAVVTEPATAVVTEPAPATVAPLEDPRIAELQEQVAALQPKPAPAPETPLYSAEEQAILTKHQEDWPDIAKGEALLRRAEYRELVGYVFKEVRGEFEKLQAKLDPALSYVESRGEVDQLSDITALVPDYADVRDKTLAWIDSQPDYLKSAYQKVAEEGTAAQVADLINRYKRDVNHTAAPVAQATPAPIAPAAPVTPALSPAAVAAAAKLTLVKTGRSEAGTATEDTFENAFATYAAEEDKRLSRK